MPAGRPSKFYPEICEELKAWFMVDPYEEIEGKRIPKQLPTLVNFARHKNLDLSTIYDWVDVKSPSFHKDFSETYKYVKDYQKEFLIQNGLSGLWNSNFGKFVAVNLTDMRDSQEIALTTESLEDKLARLRAEKND